jgi:WD40 repeat protein
MHGWHGVAFAPENSSLAAYGTEGVQLWDAEDRACRAELSAGQKDIADVAWSPDGRSLCAASWDGSVSVWDVRTKALVAVLHGGSQRMQQVEWSPDGRWIAGGDWDSRLYVWDASTLAEVHRSDRLGGHVQALAWSPDAAWLAVGGVSVVIRVLESGSWEPVGRLVGHTAPVQSLSFTPDGRTLVSACAHGDVNFWDLEAPGWRAQHRGAGREPPAGVAFSPDAKRAAVGWANGAVEIWDVERRERLRLIESGAGIRHLDWSPATPALAAARWDRDIVLLDPDGSRPPSTLAVAEPTETHFDPTGTLLAATAQDGVLRVWDPRRGVLLWEASAPIESEGWPGNLFGASWSPDGRRIVASTHAGRIQIRDASTGALLHESVRPGMIFSQFSRDGRHVLAWAYGRDQGMELLDARTLSPVWATRRTNHMWPVLAPDGERVFSANWQGFLGIWDAASGRLVAEIPGLPPGNPRVGVSPEGGCVLLAAGNRLAFFDTHAER